jgi:hypothetical protein
VGEAFGRINVFSEPPELDVFLDGVGIMKMPLYREVVKRKVTG